jgi:hypothetical protein
MINCKIDMCFIVKVLWLISTVHAVGPHLHEGMLQPPGSDDDTLGYKTKFGMVLYGEEPRIVTPGIANAGQGTLAACTNSRLILGSPSWEFIYVGSTDHKPELR